MNERIQELSDIAYKNHLVRNPNSSFGRRSDYDREFAELIVRECVTTMTNLESDIKQQFPWKKEEVVSTSGHIQKLKEHFGVKE